MTPQQRANWALLQTVLEQEYDRGFKRGLEVGRGEKADPEELSEQQQGVIFMHTRPYDPEEFKDGGKKELTFSRK